MTDNPQLQQIITTNNIVPDVLLTKQEQDLGQQKAPYSTQSTQIDYQQIYYAKLDKELENFKTKLDQEFYKNLEDKIDSRITKKLEEKKFLKKGDVKEVNLEGYIKWNSKSIFVIIAIGGIAAALIGWLFNEWILNKVDRSECRLEVLQRYSAKIINQKQFNDDYFGCTKIKK